MGWGIFGGAIEELPRFRIDDNTLSLGNTTLTSLENLMELITIRTDKKNAS